MSLSEKENSGQVPKKKISISKAKERIASYCAYQERCVLEVRNKLEEFGLDQSQIEPILETLKKEGFLNEERFVEAFVKGRFTLKKWGKIRIRQELKMRNIPDEVINKAIGQIDDEEYFIVLKHLAERKWKVTQESNQLKKKAKLQRFLVFRGFENDLIRDVIEELTKDFS